MNRRDFLKRAAALVALGVAGDQLELLERIAWKQRSFPGWTPPSSPRTLFQVVGLPGQVFEMRIYDRFLSIAEHDQIQRALTEKWGLS